MKILKDIEKKIKQKQEEVQRLNEDLLQARAYLEGLQETHRLVKRNSNTESGDMIRPGSMIHQALSLLRQEQKPMHVKDLLVLMGKEPSKSNRLSLSGSLGTYVRDRNVFSRPAPNTFGLLEFDNLGEEEIPDNFGN